MKQWAILGANYTYDKDIFGYEKSFIRFSLLIPFANLKSS